MNQRAVDHYGGDVNKLNISPSKRAKAERKYGTEVPA